MADIAQENCIRLRKNEKKDECRFDPGPSRLSSLARTADDMIVMLQSQYMDLNRDRSSSNTVLSLLPYVLCDGRDCARNLRQIEKE